VVVVLLVVVVVLLVVVVVVAGGTVVSRVVVIEVVGAGADVTVEIAVTGTAEPPLTSGVVPQAANAVAMITRALGRRRSTAAP
jgi:hypothetical protein